MNKIKELYKNNRVFRTFIQSFAGYLIANGAYAIQEAFNGGKDWYKVLLYTLLFPAISTAVAAIMNRNKDEEQIDE